MDQSETKEAIQFFYNISLIMYFDTPKLRDSVIIDTKVVYNKLSRLLSVSFLNKSFINKRLKIKICLEKLQHHGLLTKAELEKCVDFKDSDITAQFFLDIVEHKKVIAAVKDTEYYFIPCALPSIPEDEICLPATDPWVIRLKLNAGPIKEIDDIPMPAGYLPTLVIFLLMQDNTFYIKLNDERKQYRDVIKFQYKTDEGTVYLVERHLQLEVYYSLADDLPDHCSTIRHLILQSMQETQKELRIREDAITIVDSFLCSCSEGSAHHACTCKPDKRIGVCCEKGTICKLDTHHLRWLSSGIQDKDASGPQVASCLFCQSSNALGIDKLVDVKNALKRVNNWLSLGLQLGLLYTTLEQIEIDNRGKVDQCMTKMLAAWLKQQDNVLQFGIPSWSVLQTALREIGEGEIANQLYR